MIELPADVAHILARLRRGGHEAFAVGGCVRDSILGRVPCDWDIATSAAPRQVKSIFPRTFDTGIAHGTVTVALRNAQYEVTTYRVDGDYADGRHPQSVTFTRSLQEDLARRDFTINAIAYHPDEGIVDPFGGVLDIKAEKIRGVGDPGRRFQEDALRMLRAIRFSGQLGFTLEPATERAIVANSEKLRLISAERVRDELTKLLLSPYPEKLNLLVSCGLLQYVKPLPEPFTANEINIASRKLRACPKKTALVYAVLLNSRGADEACMAMDNLRFDRATARQTGMLLHWLQKPTPIETYPLRKYLSQCGADNFQDILALKNLMAPPAEAAILPLARELFDSIQVNEDCLSVKDMKINGRDLLALGYAGKDVGDTLYMLLDQVLREPKLNQKQMLISMAQI